ncbi:ATP-binding protein [Calothrix sp. PCC 6303]|uniref:ATP-binding protein n=1 Tax=Calothrix sp. PCC 6303 TaxID=1170562 RepID=UPI0002A04C22|nr:ATP-binding protein [Calothrix sp. PCC 6303]AFZ00649.1 ATP-binding region ATPase domain protein [Calothrix sp. PCC 6303]
MVKVRVSSSQESLLEVLVPIVSEGNNSDFGLESTLQELPLYTFQVEKNRLRGSDLAQVFEKYPQLPGVILLDSGQYVGMISRRQFLEFSIRPLGKEIFYDHKLSIIHSYISPGVLLLSSTTTILVAMQQSLRRSCSGNVQTTSGLMAEPIVVYTAPDSYCLLDVQELNIAAWQIRGIETQLRYERSQSQMIQNDKMASLGRLVDGVAHEILDPVNFIWGNLTHFGNYSQGLLNLIATYDSEFPNASEEIVNVKQDIEFEFIEEDLKKSLASISAGAERLKKLVTSLQNFCHIDNVYPKPADLHSCIDSVVLLINSRIKGEIDIVKNYGHLPPVYCFLGQINQVFMNVFSLAIDTLLNEAVQYKYNNEAVDKPRIEVITNVVSRQDLSSCSTDSRWVSIRIIDNGKKMSRELRQEMIESFTAEKYIEKETSLSMSYKIITARHGGEFNLRCSGDSDIDSYCDRGNEFEILLPLV